MTVQFSAERTLQTCLCNPFLFPFLLRPDFFSQALLRGEEAGCQWFYPLAVLQVVSGLKKLNKGMMQITLYVEKGMAFYISYLCTALLPAAFNFRSVFCRL